MDTFIVPATFPDLDTAKRDVGSLVDALRTAGVHAEVVGEVDRSSEALKDPEDPEQDAGRRDPGPTTRELRVRADGVEDARRRVQEVTDGQFPPGMVLLGDPVRA